MPAHLYLHDALPAPLSSKFTELSGDQEPLLPATCIAVSVSRSFNVNISQEWPTRTAGKSCHRHISLVCSQRVRWRPRVNYRYLPRDAHSREAARWWTKPSVNSFDLSPPRHINSGGCNFLNVFRYVQGMQYQERFRVPSPNARGTVFLICPFPRLF